MLTNSEFYSQDLLELVKRLNCDAPLTKVLEDTIQVGPGYGTAWYPSQREHWIRWLKEYPTPGPYRRKPNKFTPAQVVYGRLNCPPMVFWLAEAIGVDQNFLCAAHIAAISAPRNQASQTGAIRKVLCWGLVFERIKIVDSHNSRHRIRTPKSSVATRCNDRSWQFVT